MRKLALAFPVLTAILCLVAHEVSAQKDQEAKEGGQKAFEIKGEAKLNAHPQKLEKGVTYRIVVKAEGFVPTLHIGDQYGVVQSTEGMGNFEAKLIYTPTMSQEYQLYVGSSFFKKPGKGPHQYTLTVDRANFVEENKAQSPLKVSEQTHKLEAGKAYVIKVVSKDFEPNLRVNQADKTIAQEICPGPNYDVPTPPGQKPELVTTAVILPTETADHQIQVVVSPNYRLAKGALNYALTVAARKPELTVDDKLTKTDPPYGPNMSRHKAYKVKLEAGKTYQFDLRSKIYNTRLLLENEAGKALQENIGFNIDTENNARFVIRPAKAETFKIIVSSFTGLAEGAFTLTVVENPDARPSPPRFGGKE